MATLWITLCGNLPITSDVRFRKIFNSLNNMIK
jgi:hypothetical protein